MTTPYPWAGGPHPWREYRDAYGHIEVHWRDLGRGVRAVTDGARHVWHATKTSQVERRCAARHEQEHIDAGHTGCVSGTMEARIRWRAARWLCPDPHHVADAMVWAGGDVALAADHLWLDEPTMRARLDLRFMHPAERALIQRKILEELIP